MSDEIRVYSFADGALVPKEKAQEVGEALYQIFTKEGVTPDEVVEVAANPASELHPYFEWDNSEAAAAWRRQQARHLINHWRVTIVRPDRPDEKTITKAAHSVQVQKVDTDTFNKRYVYALQAMIEEDLHQQVLEDALRRLVLWKQRYKEYVELRPIILAIDEFLAGQE